MVNGFGRTEQVAVQVQKTYQSQNNQMKLTQQDGITCPEMITEFTGEIQKYNIARYLDKSILTVPLLLSDVTPVLADREDIFYKEAAIIFPVSRTAVRILQNLHHMFQQLAALQTRSTCRDKERLRTDSN